MTSPATRRQFLGGTAAAAAAGFLPAEALARSGQRAAGKADLVLVNGQVLVMDPAFRVAKAVAIANGRVVRVGPVASVRSLIGPRTEVIDARGMTVLPGINDSHVHANSYTSNLFTTDVDTATIEELVARVADAVANAVAPDSYIRGSGWNDNRMGRAPTRHDLDPVSGDHPVVLRDWSGHAVAINTKLLQLAGITAATVPPPGGVIELDQNGEPSGVLREGAASLATAIVPPFSPEERLRGIEFAVDTLLSEGITSITEPGIDLSTLDLYAGLAREGRLKQRVTVLLSAGRSVESLQAILSEYERLEDVDARFLNVVGVKIFADGIPIFGTALVHEPYLDGSFGSLVVEGSTVEEQVATLHEMVRRAHRAGFQVGSHATGDATIDFLVEGYLKAMATGKPKDPRHYVIHGDLATPKTLRTMARNGIGINMNPLTKWVIGRAPDAVMGPDRTDYQWPYRTALDLRVKVSSESDAPLSHPNWRQGVSTCVLREGQFDGGVVAGTEERINVREALRTFTSTPAWQDFAEDWKGTLQVGRVADVCVVNGDVLGTDPRELPSLPVALTILNGEVVYEKTG